MSYGENCKETKDVEEHCEVAVQTLITVYQQCHLKNIFHERWLVLRYNGTKEIQFNC